MEVYIMRVNISIILMVIAALVGFFFGAGMNEAMRGAILLSMITGFACTINAIEKNKKDWQLPVLRIYKIVKERIEGGANEKAVWRLFINCPFVCINFDFFWLNKARQLYMDF